MNFELFALPVITLLFILTIILNIKEKSMLELAPIGTLNQGGNTYNLSNYFVDSKGNLYSSNWKTWEINRRDGRDILICSNSSTDKSGRTVNSLRTPEGIKVTLRRDKLSFDNLSRNNGIYLFEVKNTTPRHFKILNSFGGI